MILKSTKVITIGILLVGLVGCNDGEKSQNTPPQVSTEENATSSNPLDKLTATLPQGISAQEARKITDAATQKLFQEYFVNGAGKQALESTIQIINARIEKMSKNGVFEGTNLNTFVADSSYGSNAQADLRPMIGYLKSMNDEQKLLYKRLIINYYIQKGYKVVEGQNNYGTDFFHYSINW